MQLLGGDYFTKEEKRLWLISVSAILLSFFLFDRHNWLTLIASLTGVTSLIYNAKGNPVGQALMVLFSLMYGIISWQAQYYGEMITYLGMTMPMAVFALVAWLRNPFGGNRAEVTVNRIGRGEWLICAILTVLITLLLCAARLPHPAAFLQYTVGNHQLCRGISYLAAQPAVCRCLCRQRYRADRSVVSGFCAG